MAEKTHNYGLDMAGLLDDADITAYSGNMAILDAQMKKREDTDTELGRKIATLGETVGTELDGKVDKVAGSSLLPDTAKAGYDAHLANKNNPHGVTAAMLGLGDVSNVPDADKPVSTAQQAALDKKVDKVAGSSLLPDTAKAGYDAHLANKNNPHGVTKAQVGLGNVNNTSDAAKPVSTAVQTALNGKANTNHGTHVTYSTDAPAAAGTADAGKAGTVARSDHVHPEQTRVSGNAGTATALTSSAGSSTQPVYFRDGKPVAVGFTVGKSVPSNAVFTDTTYADMKAATATAAGTRGLVPAPAAGAATRYLRSDGKWSVPPDTDTKYSLGSFGVTVTAEELNFTDGVTSNIQTQLDGKVDKIAGSSLLPDTAKAGYDAHLVNKSNPHGVTKAQVGLGNVNNTSDAAKPVSTAVQTALNGKVDKVAGSSLLPDTAKAGYDAHLANKSNPHGVTKAQVGLGNVNNTSDAAKPVSTAVQTALNGKANTNHGTHVTYSTDAPAAAGTADAGKAGTVARSDHVHPEQTCVSGNAGTATALTSSAGSSTKPVYFRDGKPVAVDFTVGKSVPSNAVFTDTTYADMKAATATAAGTRGLVPAPAAGAATRYLRSDGKWSVPPDTDTKYSLASFGVTVTAEELNFTNGVTSNIQTQLDGKAATSHTHSAYVNQNALLDMIYPVNSIYISYSHTSPASLFGGTWTRITDAFLWACDQAGTIGGRGGEREHTLSIPEMPRHSHQVEHTSLPNGNTEKWGWAPQTYNKTGAIENTTDSGGSASHNNMPPYIQVGMWRRTA